ncbi:SDR family oxidoreductase [Dactylosporangium sp. AC04546]|uniref:SDR family oxidoreductase n=1 Tax=Dactylosporangium sp. AC04546 TaxID=2862460 RepID=UPI001EDD8760|nr:SDR family oxidoreductase [Dactylosporangium sp. AC04546]WVK89605.1 SDR family oxidoreductase [Dactylosporangium sp. AC04546]
MDKVTIVTGGSRGIGAAACLRLARDGHRVAVGYQRAAAAAEDIAAAIRDDGGRAVAVQVDTAVEDDVIRLFDTAAAVLGPVTGLVNNAGVISPLGRLADLRAEELRRLMDVNVVGAFLCARQAARVLTDGGAIVNVSSGSATLGSPHDYIHYAASKAALDALTIGLAKELAAEGIRVNGVAPGFIDTDIHLSSGDPDRAEHVVGRIPMGRLGTPDEIAEAIAWLLSDAASYATGTTVRVTGGN